MPTVLPTHSSSVSRFYTDILFSPTPPIRGGSLEEINHGISLMNVIVTSLCSNYNAEAHWN